MKRFINGILLLLLTQGYVLAQEGVVNRVENNLAKVIFYRLPVYSGSAIKMKILANDSPVIMLANGSYYEFFTQPGEYFFSCRMGTESRIKVFIEPGKTYYIKCFLGAGFWSGNPQIELIDENIGSSVIEGGMLRPQAFKPVSMKRPKSRIGIIMSAGAGFEKVDLFVDQDNNDVTLSTGGGFSIGAKYGYEISKNFDLSLDFLYQGSTLSKALKNADASFNRMVIAITPAIIIPIRQGDYFRFKIGGGIGSYNLGSMHIDASEVGGEKMTLKYKPSIGAHLCLNFESNISEHFSMNLGVKYYNVNYSYTSEGSTHTTTNNKINNPNGSGIDFIMGYFFHF